MQKPLLIEIGVEELPAIPFLKELPNIKNKWNKILSENGLESEFDFYYTPRRLVILHTKFPIKQPDHFEEFYGAPVESAFIDGEPTPAAMGFAKKCGIEVRDIARIQKGDKEVLYYKKNISGVNTKDLIGSMTDKFLKSLSFGKEMRWGTCTESFIRPIRWICAIFGEEALEFNIFGVESSDFTYPHRSLTFNKFNFKGVKNYFEELSRGYVVINQDERRSKIVEQMDALEAISDIEIDKDDALLDEVVAITEHPTVLMGNFDELYLKLPPEVIITSMKENQRYFPTFDHNGKLTNHFVVVSNAVSMDYILIIKGNEKVLRARLSDALFFYENDLKRGLHNEGLKNIIYLDKLGSLYDKSVREERVSNYLARMNRDAFLSERLDLSKEDLKALLSKTVLNAKADLLSEVVYEFPELQGVMGYYYAKAAKEDKFLALALKEQYLPNSEDSELPSTIFSSVIALSNKLDSLMALFSIGVVPTGTKDPYALRRAVNGIIKIVLKFNLAFNIREVLAELSALYAPFDILQLENFFLERMNQILDVNPSIVKAVIESGERNIVTFVSKVELLKVISQEEGFKDLFSTFKRVANIIKDVNLDNDINVFEVLLKENEERALWEAFTKVSNKTYENIELKLRALFGLKPFIDNFFDKVMVNAEDVQLRQNRQNIIASIYKAFKSIADIKEISV
ncbi:MAG: glycine--tRNA ligase subunit beta [Campylobacteraceae bacterium]